MISSRLPTGWNWTTLEEIRHPGNRAIVSGPFGSNIGSRFFVDKGIPVIRGNNLSLEQEKYIDDGYVFITEEKAEELSNCQAVPGDIIFTAAGSIGQVGLIPEDAKYPLYVISNKQIRVRLDEKRADRFFVYYWLSSPEMVQYIQQRNTGSSVPLINLSIVRSLPVPLPPLSEQRAIAHILGTLDDKIELNRRMNATLEAMARAIFKSWFVDFEPVHAKARGVQPAGMDAEMAALFPDSFEESELGLIPAGWKCGRLDDLLILQRGFDLPKSDRVQGPYPILAASGPSGGHNEYKAHGPGVTTGRSGVLGKVFYVHENFWPLNTSLWVREFRQALPIFAYHLLQLLDLGAYDAGSAVPTLNRNHIHSLPLVLPPSSLIEVFETLVSPIFRLIKENGSQSQILGQLRDTLLPKLVSGVLRVPDVQLPVEELR